MSEYHVINAVGRLNAHGFETEIAAGKLKYRRRFVTGSEKRGALEIYNEAGDQCLTENAIAAIISEAATMEMEVDASLAARTMTKSEMGLALHYLMQDCHDASYAAGWWHHAESGIPYIPGDSARITAEDGTVTLLPWEKLPLLIQDMVLHYWPIFLGCKIALIHSETSEALEALRRGLMDDKLQHRTGLDAELSDGMIREFDIAGAIRRARRLGVVDQRQHNMEIAVTFMEKRGFNDDRPDHKLAARTSAGGKYF